MMKKVDVRGLSCPEPVLNTQQALETLEQGDSLEVIIDTVTSRENVSRMAQAKGYQVEAEETADGFRLIISQ